MCFLRRRVSGCECRAVRWISPPKHLPACCPPTLSLAPPSSSSYFPVETLGPRQQCPSTLTLSLSLFMQRLSRSPCRVTLRLAPLLIPFQIIFHFSPCFYASSLFRRRVPYHDGVSGLHLLRNMRLICRAVTPLTMASFLSVFSSCRNNELLSFPPDETPKTPSRNISVSLPHSFCSTSLFLPLRLYSASLSTSHRPPSSATSRGIIKADMFAEVHLTFGGDVMCSVSRSGELRGAAVTDIQCLSS